MPQEKLVNIKLSEIKPNPNRDLKFNPFNEEKIVALMASIGETGFWTNVIVRKSPDGKGYEQAYGHHRIESARRSGITEADFVVRDLDENMMLKMMELENQEDYRYCPLSLLESCKAVVNALAAGRIAPFYIKDKETSGASRVGGRWRASARIDGKRKHLGMFDTKEEAENAYQEATRNLPPPAVNKGDLRLAPSFVPQTAKGPAGDADKVYTAVKIAEFLGHDVSNSMADPKVRTALDALYLLEVKAISTAQIKGMNWSQLGRFVADAKATRERTILRTVKTADEIKKINAEALRIQAEQKAKEKRIADERAELVKKLAEAKREEDAKKAKEIKERIIEKEEQAEKIAETFEVKKAAIEAKVQEVKVKEAEKKKEDAYLPLRKEADRLVHIMERRDQVEEIKALARRALNANDRERLRQAAMKLGTWYSSWVADQFLPPLSTKTALNEYRKREEAKQRAAEAKETK